MCVYETPVDGLIYVVESLQSPGHFAFAWRYHRRIVASFTTWLWLSEYLSAAELSSLQVLQLSHVLTYNPTVKKNAPTKGLLVICMIDTHLVRPMYE